MAAKVLKFSGPRVATGFLAMPKTKKKPSRRRKVSETLRSSDVPATRAMLFEAVHELKHEIRESELRTQASMKALEGRTARIEVRLDRMDARFDEIDARLDRMDARLDQMEVRLDQIDARLDRMDARFDRLEAAVLDVKADVQKVLAVVHNIALRVEEQNARNIYVLDGHTNLNDRVTLLEKEVFGEK